jgi:general L-amino acid transport system permease protein
MTSMTPPRKVRFHRPPRSAAHPVRRIIGWLRANLFAPDPSIISLLLIFVLGKALFSLVQWGYVNAIWMVSGDQTGPCRAIRGIGACWAVIPEKYRFILFGTYPFSEQWRPALATLIFIALFYLSTRRSMWGQKLILAWAGALVLIGVLMWGGVFGLSYVSQDRWGGLPVTLILATFGLALGFPLGILVALGRRSKLPAIRSLCVLYVELIRGPPISLLFMASVMFPLPGWSISTSCCGPRSRAYAGAYAELRRPAGAARAADAADAWPVLLEEERPDHPAAGDPPCDPAAG